MAWVCKVCGTNNPDTSETCFVCDSVKERETAPAKKTSRSTNTNTSESASTPSAASTSAPPDTSASTPSAASTSAPPDTSASTPPTTSGGKKAWRDDRLHLLEFIGVAVLFALLMSLPDIAWSTKEWLLGIGWGLALLSCAWFFICREREKDGGRLGVIVFAAALVVNFILTLILKEKYKIISMWFFLYTFIGCLFLMRWAYKNDKKKICKLVIAEAVAAILLLASSPIIALLW